jgi:hypothetical protein
MLIHSLKKIYGVPGTMLGAKDTMMNKNYKLGGLPFLISDIWS